MGFGGGGSGSFVLPNHDHTNVLADGGALDEAVSLINDGVGDVTFLTWANALIGLRDEGKLKLLDSHTAVGVESTYTFTPAVALDSQSYSEIIVMASGRSNAAFVLKGVINGIVAGNYALGFRSNGVALTNIAATALAYCQLASATVISGGNNNFNLIWHLMIPRNDASGLGGHSICWNTGNTGVWEEYSNLIIGAAPTSISSISIQTSASTWKAECKIDTFGVKRT